MTNHSRTNGYAFDLSITPTETRGKVWKDKLNEFFYDYDFKLPDNFRDGSFKGCRIGDLSFASIKSDPMSVSRTPSHVARNPHDFYFMLLPRGNKIFLSQGGNDASVGDGQFSFVSANEPYAYVQNENELFNNLILPGHIVRRLSPKILDKVARPSNDDAMATLFANFANEFCENIGRFDERTEIGLSAILLNLLELVLDGADSCSTQKSVLFAHRNRILQAIEEGFRDPSFGITSISTSLRISKRYIHQIFADKRESVSDLIRKRRIEEARRIMTAYGPDRQSISTLAYKVGFINLSHFSRVFKDETGCNPSEFARSPATAHIARQDGRVRPALHERPSDLAIAVEPDHLGHVPPACPTGE